MVLQGNSPDDTAFNGAFALLVLLVVNDRLLATRGCLRLVDRDTITSSHANWKRHLELVLLHGVSTQPDNALLDTFISSSPQGTGAEERKEVCRLGD